MKSCISCGSSIDEYIHHYNVMDIGPELLSLLEGRIQHEILNDSSLCQECFDNLTTSLGHVSSQQRLHISLYDINICFCCRASLLRRRSLVLPEGSERCEIVRTSVTEVPRNARICYKCWFRVRRRVSRSQNVVTRNTDRQTTPEVGMENCISCCCSLFGKRTHILPEGPERHVIANRIIPRQIPINARVCYACWVAVRRHVQRNQNEEQISIKEEPSAEQVALPVMETDNEPQGRQETETQDEQETESQDEQETELQDEQETESQDEQETESQDEQKPEIQTELEPEQPPQQNMDKIILDNIKRVSDTAASCFVPGCRNPERLTVPKHLRKRLLSKYKLYIPKNSRVCNDHRIVYDWDFIEAYDFIHIFNKNHVEDMVQLGQQSPFITLDFENIEELDDEQCQYWTGVTKEKFLAILDQSSIDCRNPRLALGLYLMKLRTGEPLRHIASLMRIATSRVCNLIAKVKICLTNNFVPRHLDVQHVSREELIQNNPIIPEDLFGNTDVGD